MSKPSAHPSSISEVAKFKRFIEHSEGKVDKEERIKQDATDEAVADSKIKRLEKELGAIKEEQSMLRAELRNREILVETLEAKVKDLEIETKNKTSMVRDRDRQLRNLTSERGRDKRVIQSLIDHFEVYAGHGSNLATKQREIETMKYAIRQLHLQSSDWPKETLGEKSITIQDLLEKLNELIK